MQSLLWAAIVLASAGEPSVRVETRAILPDCEFVYAVETDFAFELQAEPGSALKLSYGFQDAYGKDGRWLSPGTLDPAESQPGRYQAALTRKTFSVSERYLYREMDFVIEVRNPDGSERRLPADPGSAFHVKFGRMMGEPCYRSRASAPYTKRDIEQVPAGP